MNRVGIRLIVILPMLGSLMFVTTFVMKGLPNIHLLALFIITFTRVYRRYALIPIYIYVLLEGFYQGFGIWWLPYLYLWTVLWAVVMLLPKNMSTPVATIVFCIAGGLHGLAFGTLYAPVHALFYGLSMRGMLAWIATGLPFDVIHGISDAIACTLAVPLITLLRRLERIGERE